MAKKEVLLAFINLLGAEGAEMAVNRYYKRDLTDEENIEAVLAALNKSKSDLQEAKSKTEKQADSFKALQIQKAEEIKSISSSSGSVENRYLSTLDALVNLVASGQSPALIAVSEGGLGKTSRVLASLASHGYKEEVDYAFSSGYTTPLELYHFLYKHRDKKAIVMDDLIGAIDNPKGQTLLRAATWGQTTAGGARIIEYHTTSNKLEVPSTFEIKAGIIILTNRVPAGEIARAFISRCLYLEMNFTDEEKLSAIAAIASQPYKQTTAAERQGVLDWLAEEGRYKTLKELNFRTLIKLFDLAHAYPGSWKNHAVQIAQEDEPKRVMREIILSKLQTKEALQQWEEKTGMSRRSYFLYRKMLMVQSANESQMHELHSNKTEAT